MKLKFLRRKSRGETIVEATVAMIIFMLGMATLQGGLAFSANMMRKADEMRSDTEKFTKELRNGDCSDVPGTGINRAEGTGGNIEFVLANDAGKKMFETLNLSTADTSPGYHIKYYQTNGTTLRGDIAACQLGTYTKTVNVAITTDAGTVNEAFDFYTYRNIENTAAPE